MDTQQLIEQIRAVDSAEDMGRVAAMIRAESGPMDPEVQAALLAKLEESTAKSQADREDIISTLQVHGVSYPLTDWLTPKNYAKRFDLKSGEVVLNWISRGIIPPDHVKEIPELGLRLVKAVEYNPRSYRTGGPERVAKTAS